MESNIGQLKILGHTLVLYLCFYKLKMMQCKFLRDVERDINILRGK